MEGLKVTCFIPDVSIYIYMYLYKFHSYCNIQFFTNSENFKYSKYTRDFLVCPFLICKQWITRNWAFQVIHIYPTKGGFVNGSIVKKEAFATNRTPSSLFELPVYFSLNYHFNAGVVL